MEWIIENKEWLFSGIGLTVISGFLIKRKFKQKNIRQKISSGDGSTNIQSGNDINIKVGDKNAR